MVLKERDAVSASLFRQIERTVAPAKDLEPVGIRREKASDAEAGGEPNLLAEVIDGEVGQAVSERLGDLGGARLACTGQDGDEFLATEAGDMVDLAQILPETPSGMGQDGVAAFVAVFVVDGFEAVEVEDDQREVGALTTGILDGFRADLLKRPAVQQAGQGVSLRLSLELVLELRHGQPDDPQCRHDGDQDGSKERDDARGGRAQLASRIPEIRLPPSQDADDGIEGEESSKASPGIADPERS